MGQIKRVAANLFRDSVVSWSADMSPIGAGATLQQPMQFISYRGETRMLCGTNEGSGNTGVFLKRTGGAWGAWLTYYGHQTRKYPSAMVLSDGALLFGGPGNVDTYTGRIYGVSGEVVTGNPELSLLDLYQGVFLYNEEYVFQAGRTPGPHPPSRTLIVRRNNLEDPSQGWTQLANLPSYIYDYCLVPFDGVWNGNSGYYTIVGDALVHTPVANGPALNDRPMAVYNGRLYAPDYTNRRVLVKDNKDGPWAVFKATTGYETWEMAAGAGALLVGGRRVADNKCVVLQYNSRTEAFVEQYVAPSGASPKRIQYVPEEGVFYLATDTGYVYRGVVTR